MDHAFRLAQWPREHCAVSGLELSKNVWVTCEAHTSPVRIWPIEWTHPFRPREGPIQTKKAAAEMTKAAEAPNDLGGSFSAKRFENRLVRALPDDGQGPSPAW